MVASVQCRGRRRLLRDRGEAHALDRPSQAGALHNRSAQRPQHLQLNGSRGVSTSSKKPLATSKAPRQAHRVFPRSGSERDLEVDEEWEDRGSEDDYGPTHVPPAEPKQPQSSASTRLHKV